MQNQIKYNPIKQKSGIFFAPAVSPGLKRDNISAGAFKKKKNIYINMENC